MQEIKSMKDVPDWMVVGAKVNYHSIIGRPPTLKGQEITHAPYPLGGKTQQTLFVSYQVNLHAYQ